MLTRSMVVLSALTFTLLNGMAAEAIRSGPDDLTRLSIEELMKVEVSSVFKKTETVADAPAAVYVLSQEDIHRSGVTTIADALRMVPGLDVAGINAGTWAISGRGFNGRFANKLLVLMDGRSVYSPLFSGVYWDVQDTMLDDIERIEVVRGPSASLWGANAVNGVVNIITKKAKDTQGGLLVAGAGSLDLYSDGVRYGARIGTNAFYRAYVKGYARDDLESTLGGSGNDAIGVVQGGFRLDWTPGEINTVTLQGDAYAGDVSRELNTYATVQGGNVLTRWTHQFSPDSELTAQMYFDRTVRAYEVLTEHRNTFDLDVQHRFALGDHQEILWGGGYRVTSDQTWGGFRLSFNPPDATDQMINIFAQDDIALVTDRLHLIAGARFEHNDFTGFEVEPTLRLRWTPNQKQTVWAAASRAVRTPSRVEESVLANQGNPPGLVTNFAGNANIQSEDVVAFELGYRIQAHPRLSFDLATHYNVYNQLRSLQADSPYLSSTPPPAHPVLPLMVNNAMDGETWGLELSATWQPVDIWRLNASYTYLNMNLHNGFPVHDATIQSSAGDSPENQFQVRSYLDLPAHLQFDAMVYYVDQLPNQNVSSYVRLDLRLGWRPWKNVEFSLVGQNLLEHRHGEFGANFLAEASLMQRSVYGKVTWSF